MSKHQVLVKNEQREFLSPPLNDYLNKQYKSDTPLDNAVVPYIIMGICALIDASVFYSLFSLTSYDSPLMIFIQIGCFLFAYDVVPVYMGIQCKRLKEKLSADRIMLCLSFVVCGVALIVNILLNCMTIELMNPDPSSVSTGFFGATEQTTSDTVDPSVIALTIFRIVSPVLTSLGSFFISYLTYKPLKVKKRQLKEAIGEKKDEIRRLEDLLYEYDSEPDFDKHLLEDDDKKFEETAALYLARVNRYCNFVDEELKAHLGTPAAISALSESRNDSILERLNREYEALYRRLPADPTPCVIQEEE